MASGLTRRSFLKGLGAYSALTALAPGMSVSVANACAPSGKHIVCIFFDGGFDWLGWVFPDSPTARQIRPTIQGAGVEAALHPLASTNWGLHGNLSNLSTLYGQGKVAIVPQTHYVNATGSHAESREQYMRGVSIRGNSMQSKGVWIRLAESNNFPSRRCIMSVSGTDRMTEPAGKALNMDNLNGFGFAGEAGGEGGGRISTAFQAIAAGPASNDMEAEVQSAWDALKVDSAAIQSAVSSRPNYTNLYPALNLANSGLARNLEEAETVIRGFPTQATLTFIRFGGHDTHSGELTRNANLTSEFDRAVNAFVQHTADIAGNVLVTTMSEFGRTNRENGDGGTDHAQATAMIAIGNGVNGGVYGDIPTSQELLASSNSLPIEHNHVDVQWELYERYLGLSNLSTVFPGHTYSRIGIIA